MTRIRVPTHVREWLSARGHEDVPFFLDEEEALFFVEAGMMLALVDAITEEVDRLSAMAGAIKTYPNVADKFVMLGRYEVCSGRLHAAARFAKDVEALVAISLVSRLPSPYVC